MCYVLWRKHPRESIARPSTSTSDACHSQTWRIVTRTTCQICTRDYRAPNRLLSHVKALKTCSAPWRVAEAAPTEEETRCNADEIRREQLEHRRAYPPDDNAETPWTPMCGPPRGLRCIADGGPPIQIPVTSAVTDDDDASQPDIADCAGHRGQSQVPDARAPMNEKPIRRREQAGRDYSTSPT